MAYKLSLKYKLPSLSDFFLPPILKHQLKEILKESSADRAELKQHFLRPSWPINPITQYVLTTFQPESRNLQFPPYPQSGSWQGQRALVHGVRGFGFQLPACLPPIAGPHILASFSSGAKQKGAAIELLKDSFWLVVISKPIVQFLLPSLKSWEPDSIKWKHVRKEECYLEYTS